MSDCSQWRLPGPIFLVVLGVLSISELQYTVQKHEVFNGWFPRCVRIVKVWWCLERQVFAFELATLSTLKLENFCHIHTDKRGIHSLFVKWRSNFHARSGNRSILLPLTSSGSKIDIWEDSWDNCKPSAICLLKNDYDYQKQLPSWYEKKKKKKNSLLNKDYSDTSNFLYRNNLNYLVSYFPKS